jgi:hypothetical protein
MVPGEVTAAAASITTTSSRPSPDHLSVSPVRPRIALELHRRRPTLRNRRTMAKPLGSLEPRKRRRNRKAGRAAGTISGTDIDRSNRPA